MKSKEQAKLLGLRQANRNVPRLSDVANPWKRRILKLKAVSGQHWPEKKKKQGLVRKPQFHGSVYIRGWNTRNAGSEEMYNISNVARELEAWHGMLKQARRQRNRAGSIYALWESDVVGKADRGRRKGDMEKRQ